MGGESQTKLKKTRKEWFSELSLQPGQAKSEADLYCKNSWQQGSRGIHSQAGRTPGTSSRSPGTWEPFGVDHWMKFQFTSQCLQNLICLPGTDSTSTDKIFLNSVFFKMFCSSNRDVPGGLVSKEVYVSPLKEGITKKALKYFLQRLQFHLAVYLLTEITHFRKNFV